LRLAARQHGVVARFQLLAAGVSAEQIQRRLQAGRLTALHEGVYLVGAVAPTHANEMAALLAYRLAASKLSAHGSILATFAIATGWR